MKKNGSTITLITVSLILFFCANTCFATKTPSHKPTTIRAGLRSSPYGPRTGFPAPPYWLNAARSMASRFERAIPSLVWIVGTMETVNHGTPQKSYSGRVRLSFPAPSGASFPNIVFTQQDANEAYLEQFDKNGLRIWLQVEPANPEIGTLI
ncbi:MAG: hypothetical protein WCL37_05815, partial [Chrysiogenales bacterium]